MEQPVAVPVKDGLARLGWRSYRYFYNFKNRVSQVHFFPPQMGSSYGSTYTTLCGRPATRDCIDDQGPRKDLPSDHYCKKCVEMAAKMDPDKKKRVGLE